MKWLDIDFYITLLLSFVIGLCIYTLLLPVLRRWKFGQTIREDGPKRHLTKAGTPTMGGIGILVSTILIFSLFIIGEMREHPAAFANQKLEVLLVVFPFLGFGLIGWLDDHLIVVQRNNHGLSPKFKFLLQLFVAALFYVFLRLNGHDSTINLFGISVPLGFGYGVFILLFMTGASNATNLTDGIDGLLGGLALISFAAFGVIAFVKEEWVVAAFCLSAVVALICFLYFNLPVARVFMGDTGSLAIGGALAGVAICLRCEFVLLLIGIVYIIETLTVILQVWYFKRTKGKRLFRMSPFHHHLELSGYSEWEIDAILWGINFVFAVLGVYVGVKLF